MYNSFDIVAQQVVHDFSWKKLAFTTELISFSNVISVHIPCSYPSQNLTECGVKEVFNFGSQNYNKNMKAIPTKSLR